MAVKKVLMKVRSNFSKYKKQILSGVCLVALGVLIGYLSGGGFVTHMKQEEVEAAHKADQYQYLPMDGSLEEALRSGYYSHCVVYPGIGVQFTGKDNNGDLIVGQSLLTYPAHKNSIFAGTKVSTPIEVIKGELGSPVKVEFKEGLKTKSAILARVMVKKCLKVSEPDSIVKPLDQ
jgi:hypothetical protein